MKPHQRLTLIYGLVCLLWIFVSDYVVLILVQGRMDELAAVQSFKGSIFIIITTIFLYFLLRREFNLQELRQNLLIIREQQLQAETQNRLQLQRDLEREQEMRTVRSRFVSMVSHEFRTPLAAIQTSTDLLLHYGDKVAPEKRQRYLKQVQDQVKSINDLLNDFLTLSRMESVDVQFDPEPIHLTVLLREAVEAAHASWHDRAILLETEESCPAVRSDRKLLRQAVLNLISNAIKYSPSDTPVTVRLSQEPDSVLIEVKDKGIGIPEADMARMNETFFRASNVGQVEGTGLGLAIVRRAIEAHGGKLIIDTALGVGTTMGLLLPVRENP